MSDEPTCANCHREARFLYHDGLCPRCHDEQRAICPGYARDPHPSDYMYADGLCLGCTATRAATLKAPCICPGNYHHDDCPEKDQP